jgi:hypothetical protein
MAESAVQREAWRIHHAEGHPDGYEGPCWGPTAQNVEQAKKNLARGSATSQPTADASGRR